jgi:hypothetical protein
MATASNLPKQVVLREIISSTGVGGVLGKEPYTSKTGCMNLPSLTSIIGSEAPLPGVALAVFLRLVVYWWHDKAR